MRNKKSFFGMALFVAVLLLGVGYAVVSSNELFLKGTVTTKTSTMNVVYDTDTTVTTDKTDVAVADDVTVSADYADSENATLTVTGLSKIGDKVSATYTIKNNETDLDTLVTVKTNSLSDGENEYFKVTTDIDAAGKTIAKSASDTVTVYVELIKVPIEDKDCEAAINITFDAAPSQPAN